MKDKSFLTSHNQKKYAGPSPIGSGGSRIAIMQEMVGDAQIILDVGCWDGSASRNLLRKGCRILGLDNSIKAVEMAMRNGLEARVAELDETWPVDDESVDAIIAGEVIEHVMDVNTFTREAGRVLRPSGRFIVSTPNLAALGRRLMLLLGKNPHIEIVFEGEAAGHVRYFTPKAFQKFMESRGFWLERLTSDTVNFNASGSIHSDLLARLIPTIGRCLIGCFRKARLVEEP